MSKEYFSVMETSPFNYCLWYVNELACHLSYALFLSLSPRLIGTPLPACLPLNLLLSNLLLPQQLPSFFWNSESCVKTLLNMRAFLSLSIDVILSLTKQQRLDVQRYRHSTCVAQQSAFPCSKVVVCIEKPMDSVVVDECCFLKSKDLRYIEPYS